MSATSLQGHILTPAGFVHGSLHTGADGRVAGVHFLMKKNKITVIWGEAKLTKPNEIVVSKPTKPAVQPQNPPPKDKLGSGTYTAKNIIIATGARPRVLPGLEPDGKLVWTYFEAMVPKAMPKSLLVVGSGAIGIEFASFYNSMGVDVTVVEVMDQIMPVEDAEISKVAQKQLEKQGLKFRLAAKVTKLDKAGGRVTLKHGGIKQLDMPAMTLVFRAANPRLLDGLAVGDRVFVPGSHSFEGVFNLFGGAGSRLVAASARVVRRRISSIRAGASCTVASVPP